MNVRKFNDFLNEDIQLPVLDVVIDDNGNIYNGMVDGFPLTKGNIVRNRVDRKITVTSIISNNGTTFPAGIDKNGNIVAPTGKVDEEGYVLNTRGERIKIPQSTYGLSNKFQNKFWKKYKSKEKPDLLNYSFLVPITPTGWVNVKIDMEVLKRVRRYSRNLGTNTKKFESFKDKLNDLQKMSAGVKLRKRVRETIQKEMSVIILLHYINEIKDFFTPGSSGSLFESFIAGLIPNARVKDDNSLVDVNADGINYQLKLYDNLQEYIPISLPKEEDETIVDYHLIGLKYADRIVLFILDSQNGPSDYRNFTTKAGVGTKKMINSPYVPRYTFEISNIEEKIRNIAKGLKESLDSLYLELSGFQYNIETIISGVNEKGEILDGLEFKKIESDSKQNIENMRGHLDSLVRSITQHDKKD
jgi:hypothetical protein